MRYTSYSIMKKIIVLGFFTVIIVASIVSYATISNSPKPGGTKTATTATTKPRKLIIVDGCTILTETIAKQFLGDTATKADTATPMIYSPDIDISDCSYTTDTGAISLTVKSAKSENGAISNESMFGSNKPGDVTAVQKIGDKAYYNPKTGQINILKGSNWYILASTGKSAEKASLDEVRRLAEQLSFK